MSDCTQEALNRHLERVIDEAESEEARFHARQAAQLTDTMEVSDQ